MLPFSAPLFHVSIRYATLLMLFFFLLLIIDYLCCFALRRFSFSAVSPVYHADAQRRLLCCRLFWSLLFFADMFTSPQYHETVQSAEYIITRSVVHAYAAIIDAAFVTLRHYARCCS